MVRDAGAAAGTGDPVLEPAADAGRPGLRAGLGRRPRVQRADRAAPVLLRRHRPPAAVQGPAAATGEGAAAGADPAPGPRPRTAAHRGPARRAVRAARRAA